MNRALYHAALRLLPKSRAILRKTGMGLDGQREAGLLNILQRQKALGAELRLFGPDGHASDYLYGNAGRGRALNPDTAFRLASISKLVTAACALKLVEQGKLSLDRDVNEYLPFRLSHPAAPDMPISLRMLMSHTAGLRDGDAYHKGLGQASLADRILAGDSYLDSPPGESWGYSNLGAGLVACVMEAALALSFECIMQSYLFDPLGMEASFYPQRIKGELADARRIMPPQRRANFDAMARKRRPLGDADAPNPLQHYHLAQGSCCMNAKSLQRLMLALMRPGFLSRDSLADMHKAQVGFGARSSQMRQGLGVFVLDDPAISPLTLYGHQGNAYGAVHAAFYEPVSARGLIFLSTGVSEARREFLCEVVEDLLKLCFEGEVAWPRT
jgi:CubicO group peptidase (beta-lactamase class C family)